MKKIYLFSAILLSQLCVAQSEKSIRQIQHEEYSKYNFTRQEQWDSLYLFQHPGEILQTEVPKIQRSQACTLKKRVFGWHPYWLAANEYLNYDYSLLSDLSYFGYDVNVNTGYATSTHGWMTSPVVTNALNAGIRVNLCVVLFSSHATLLNNSTAKQNLINSLISNVQQRGAHGVNIDFEGMDPSTSASFHAFMNSLAQQMHAAVPGSEVSIAMAAGNWSQTYSSVMVPYVDLFLIMGYDYHWASAPKAGPVAPKHSGGFWTMGDITNSITYYLNAGIPNSKLALGVPYYGYDWPTTSLSLNASTTGTGFSRKYTNAVQAAATYGRKWDNYSSVPYFTYNNGGPRQCFYDDEVSMALKYDVVKRFNIAGIGIWALGYDEGSMTLWNLLKDKFTDCEPPVSCTGNLIDMGGPGNYYNNENWTYTIAPAGSSSVTMTFSSFNTEANYDFLSIYDGATTTSPLIGKYSGTTSPGTVTANSGKMTLKFTSDNATTGAGFAAAWNCSVDNIAPTTSISAPTTWITQNNFTVNFTDADNSGGSGLEKSMYHVVDYNGTEWRANNTLGFFRDNFDNAIHTDWSKNTGTWAIAGGVLEQNNEALANTNISAPLTQNLSNRYLYNWSGKIEGAGTTRRAGFHFMCDNATSANRGNSYMVWFRADQGQVEIYESVNDVLGSPVQSAPVTITAGTFYDYKVVYDRSTGIIDVYLNNTVVASWTDPTPLSNGSFVSFRNGDSKFSVNNFYVYRSRNATTTVNVGTAANDAIRYQNSSPTQPSGMIKSIVMDVAGNLSGVASQSVDVDWTAPADVTVIRDGTGSDISITNSTTQLSANWDQSTDTHSDVVKYYYAIGKTPGATDVVNWTSNALNTTVTKTGLNLTVGQMYYFSTKAENGAGLQSIVKSSNGQTVQISTGIDEAVSGSLQIYPNPASDHLTLLLTDNISNMEVDIYNLLGKKHMSLQVTEQQTTIDITDLSAGVYIIEIRSENKIKKQKFIKH
ncbi:MAG: glycosyl hydrolase family 18 protein [Bacteroidota bacterium]